MNLDLTSLSTNEEVMSMVEFFVHTKSSCGVFGNDVVDLEVSCKESWTVWGCEKGATLPHDHGTFISNFTTVLYLELANIEKQLG